MTASALDIDWVRGRFPAFAEPSLAGWAFFENAGGSYPARETVERLTDFYTRLKVQPYAPYPAAEEGGRLMDEARARIAGWLCVEPGEVVFGPSTTANVYTLANAVRETLAPDDAVIVADQNHEANAGAWARLAEAGAEVRMWEADADTGLLDLADLESLLDDKVRVVAAPHCSNIVGAPNDVGAIARAARAAGAISVIDGVSHAPHGLPDVAALACDVYMFSAYKTYGPHQGVMVVRGDLAARLPNQGHWFNADYPEKRLAPAGPDHAQEAAMNGVADYLDAFAAHHGAPSEGPARTAAVERLMRAHETRLLAPLLHYLRARNDVRILGPSDPAARVPTVALVCDRPGEAVAAELTAHGIMAGGGDFYARRLVDKMGAGHGALRLSFVHYTTEAEVTKLIEALDATL